MQAPPQARSVGDRFQRFATRASERFGNPSAFLLAVVIVIAWLVTGPIFRFSDAWQLVINTATTIVTFLMVFLIQNGQNRDAKALHLKLDELIRAMKGARNHLVDLEECSDEELDQLKKEFNRIRNEHDPREEAKAEKHLANIEMEEQHRQS